MDDVTRVAIPTVTARYLPLPPWPETWTSATTRGSVLTGAVMSGRPDAASVTESISNVSPDRTVTSCDEGLRVPAHSPIRVTPVEMWSVYR